MTREGDLDRYAARRGELIANNFVLGNVLGVGGMGVVYAALQRSLDRVVAIKVPRPELALDPRVRHRMQLEGLATSRIAHRNSVRMIDFGDHGGAPYLVMEHVAGQRLGEVIAEHGPLPLGSALDLVRQVTAVLAEAHVSGIVHAAVKCAKVLVETRRDRSLVARLIDWGIARLPDRDDAATSTVITGGIDHLAPEVLMGARPTFAADVYAIGVMLYELVGGVTPFPGDLETKRHAPADLPLPLATARPDLDIPAALDGVVTRALARDPASRFPDAGSLGRELAKVVAPDSLALPRSSAVFSAEATPASMSVVHALAHSARSPVAQRRADVVAALREGDVDAIIVAYLELSRTLVDDNRLDHGIVELERALELIESMSSISVWRVQLALAQLYDQRGDHSRASKTARLARDGAARAGSQLGCDRADRLVARLGQSTGSTSRSRERS